MVRQAEAVLAAEPGVAAVTGPATTTATTTAGRPSSIHVVSVPAGHPYVRHTRSADPTDTRVVVRADPHPDEPWRDAEDRWWPPVALGADWLREQRFDVLHVHFGFDERTPEELAAVADVLDALGRPLVLTVHDLRNPHHDDPRVLDAQLDVLVPRAAAVVTLTRSAAAELHRRWGVEAVVLPHPHLVDLAHAARIRADRRAAGAVVPVVGVAVKDLRHNTDPLRVLPALARAVRRHPEAVLRVTAHRALLERWDDRACALVAWLDAEVGDRVEVVWHDRWTDEELAEQLAGLHVAVLPYRFGTHSGWLEACHDVGTRVLAPSLGCYADQGADATYAADEDALDEESVEDAVARLLDQPTDELAGPEPAERARQREQVADALHALYAGLLGSEGGR